MSNLPSPPKQAHRFLRWFCREDYLEEIEGNLLELYEQQYTESPKKAQKQFLWNVLRHFRPAFIRSFKVYQPDNHRAMLRHNLILSLRNFQRYKSTFFINLIGLSSGLACTLLIFLWVYDELSVDKFHANDTQLYQVMEHQTQATGIITGYNTAGPTAKALAEEMPEVERAVTVTFFADYTLSVGDQGIRANGTYASADFFHLFSYRLIQGNKNQVLANKSNIVISESLAVRLFGTTENIVGRLIEWERETQYQVAGVYKDIPSSSSMHPDFVLPYEVFRSTHEYMERWDNTMPRTYLLLREGVDIASFNRKIAHFIRDKTDGKITHRTLFAVPYSDAYLHSRYEQGKLVGGRIEYVQLFSLIALFILLMACINFMNLSTAHASRRTKEIGVKKAMGAPRATLINQYLSESVLTALFSLVVALLLVAVFLPQFNTLNGKQLTIPLSVSSVSLLLGIIIFTGLVAGSYPAFFLSGFNPIMVLKGATGKMRS
ncbi:MAG: ABC transporter permease, partial [Bacteroidota bacterium]